ncbi:DNA-binding response regulator [Alteromonas sediminis]|uniref:DNA-binding response regulator n=1 Tax=Alteromonas sediminis TaxID=2259342 RepID=A0A3N5YQP1_9ALTE|nr:response regulator transcription factor [Alteromonas sediminis]RPJ68531.1 DNA-binding response regulator [Alteromonas sediminis]
MASILIVEDDIDIATGIAEYVETIGHELDFAYTGTQAQQMIRAERYDLILLDINLPHLSGYDICQDLLSDQLAAIPVIMMSANTHEKDVIKGFQSGAWDYLKKPFSYAELTARINVALARGYSNNTAAGVKHLGFVLDLESKSLSHECGTSVQLKSLGFLILKILLEHAPKTVSTSSLIDQLWPDEVPPSNPLRANIYTLRQQLKKAFNKELVQTVKGIGYKFDADA